MGAETQARTDLSGDQAQLLISAHNQELEELQLRLKNQHNRQRAELREKMNARRARKKKALSNRQEMEEEREKLEQKKELTKVQAKATKQAEKEAILEGIERNGADASQKVIQSVLEKRHKKELEDLLSEFELKKKLLLDEALKPLLEKYYNDRDAMVAKYESELVKLDNQELPEDELKKLKEKLRREHEKELSELDEDHQKSKAKIEKDINDQVDLELAQEKLHLKERHYKEFADSLRELAPSPTSKKQLRRRKNVPSEWNKPRKNLSKSVWNLARRKEKLLKDKREKIKEEIAKA